MCKIYGISQNPITKDYIIIQDVYFSGNKKIDNLIQEMQSKRSSHNDITFEWIPYYQFENIKEIGKGGFAKVYSTIWKDGPLDYNYNEEEYIRQTVNKTVVLKCIYNSQNFYFINEFLNKVKILY